MDRNVIRTKIISGISSKIIQEGEDKPLHVLVEKCGLDDVLKTIFDEDELTYQQLYNEYKRFVYDGSGTFFSWLYKVNSRFGITIDEHIYLYHYDSRFSASQKELFGWEYMDSRKYIGDSWWFEDKEILDDIQQLSILDFMEKYKGY